MHPLPPKYESEKVEGEARALWNSRSLPPPDGVVGPAGGPRVHELLFTLTPARGITRFVQAAVRADTAARYLALAGRRAGAPLLARLPSDDPMFAKAVRELRRLSIWPGSAELKPVASGIDPAKVQSAVSRLGRLGALVHYEGPVRVCPHCGVPRPPPAIVYSEEPGPAYLVRFAIELEGEPASLLAWTDSAWKLLGAPALVVNPDQPYVRARFTRRGVSEIIVVSRSAVERLRGWLEGVTIEPLSELPGRLLEGTPFRHPLATEFPTLRLLPAPAGRVGVAAEVEDRGTGVVALVPHHGASDSVVARRLGIEGWPVADTSGKLTGSLRHKYSDLAVEAGEAFILRDLADGGYLFAQLQVRRGLPRCAVCGVVLVWQPGTVWALRPGRLTPEWLELARRAWPTLEVPAVNDPVPWPVSELGPTAESAAPELRECHQCGRLGAPGSDAPCECGGRPEAVRRRLLPSFLESLVLAQRAGPYSPGELVDLFLAERCAGPGLLHMVSALDAAGATPAELRLTSLPTIPLEAFPTGPSADADRGAFLSIDSPPRAGADAVQARRVQADRTLRQFWEVARELVQLSANASFSPPTAQIGSTLSQLPEEDRAFLSRFERMRLEVIRRYDAGVAGRARERLTRFFESDLRGGYLVAVRSRLQPGAPAGPKAAALRVLHHSLTCWAELYAPIAPHATEVVLHALRDTEGSLFEHRLTPIQESALDAGLELAYGRWLSFAAALNAYRREVGLPADRTWPGAIVATSDDSIGAELLPSVGILARLGRVDVVEVTSPGRPWAGQQVVARPIQEEIQKAYGAQAGRIVRILEGMNPRRVQDGLRNGTLHVSMEGIDRPILPAMVEFVESLPPSVAAIPWPWGQILVKLPETQQGATGPPTPALSPDGFRVLREIRHRIDRAPAASAVDRVVVAANGPLLADLTRNAEMISELLGGVEFLPESDSSSFVPAETSEGRTGRGARWQVWVPGTPEPGRPAKHRPVRAHRARVAVAPVSDEAADDPGFLAPALLEREAAVRVIVEAADREFGRPLLGPAKVAAAWDAGFADLEAMGRGPFERLSAVSGFGPEVAAEIVRHYGGAVPQPLRLRAHPPSPPDELPAPAPPPAEPPVPPPPPPEILDAGGVPAPSSPAPPPAVRAPEPVAPASLPSVGAPPISPPPAPLVRPSAPVAAVSSPMPAPPSLPPGIELWPGSTADAAWHGFLDATAAGDRGICVSREFPDRLRSYLGARDVAVVWLSNVGREGSIRPGDLEAIADLFRRSLDERAVRAIYLDGVEYLVRLHTLERTLQFLSELDRQAEAKAARVWIPLNPALVDPAATDRMRQQFRRHALE